MIVKHEPHRPLISHGFQPLLRCKSHLYLTWKLCPTHHCFFSSLYSGIFLPAHHCPATAIPSVLLKHPLLFFLPSGPVYLYSLPWRHLSHSWTPVQSLSKCHLPKEIILGNFKSKIMVGGRFIPTEHPSQHSQNIQDQLVFEILLVSMNVRLTEVTVTFSPTTAPPGTGTHKVAIVHQ